jgi:hypothetical protein
MSTLFAKHNMLVIFFLTGFTIQTAFIVIWYSVAIIGWKMPEPPSLIGAY